MHVSYMVMLLVLLRMSSFIHKAHSCRCLLHPFRLFVYIRRVCFSYETHQTVSQGAKTNTKQDQEFKALSLSLSLSPKSSFIRNLGNRLTAPYSSNMLTSRTERLLAKPSESPAPHLTPTEQTPSLAPHAMTRGL